MSVSSRDRQATIYPYVGANVGGFVTSSYGAARGTYWCRVSFTPGTELMLDAQASQTQNAVIELADEVPVAVNDLLVVDGVQWQVGPITLRRHIRSQILHVMRNVDDAALATG